MSDVVVEIEFSIGKKNYKVIRGIKPNLFEIYCDGILINQDAKSKDYQEYLEKFILKFNYKSFTQIVILGSASFVPFMQLAPADRRAIIEDLLDIQIFSSMNSILKEKLSDIKDESNTLKYQIDLTNEKIDLQKQNIEEHRKNSDSEIQKKQLEIETSNKQIDKLNIDIELIQKHISILEKNISDKIAIESKSKKFIQLEARMESNIKKINKDIQFYHDNDNCPTCKQTLDVKFKQSQILDRNNKKLEVEKGLSELNSQIDKVNERMNNILSIHTNITQHNNEISKHNSTITAVNKYIKKLQSEIVELTNRKINLEQDNEKLKVLRIELDGFELKKKELSGQKHYYDCASILLKDTGIKTKIIKQYLPIINKLVNKYLSAMDFFVNFNINENFEETIKSRHRDEFSYANFSEGEKQKIDLALLLTWRQVSKLKNSTNTNLLILDEIFDSSLDTTSVELSMGLLKDLSSDTNVFVISHKSDQMFDKFRSIIRFTKKNNFSVIEK